MSGQPFQSNLRVGSQRTVGKTTYLVTRYFKPDAKEDANAKMSRIVRNEALEVLRNQEKKVA